MNKRLKDSNFRVLYETAKLVLGHEFEYAYLISKRGNKEIYLGDFYGDASCGLISRNDDWCLAGGETLVIWKNDGTILTVGRNNLRWITELRQTAAHEAELLIDPRSEHGAVWKLNTATFDFEKLRDYKCNNNDSDDFDW